MIRIQMRPKTRLTKNINVRVESQVRDDLDWLSDKGIDTSELLRDAIRLGIKQAKDQVDSLSSKRADAV